LEEAEHFEKENLHLVFERSRQAGPIVVPHNRVFRDITHRFVPHEQPVTKARAKNTLLTANLSKNTVAKTLLRA
jgi:hypothetical protein